MNEYFIKHDLLGCLEQSFRSLKGTSTVMMIDLFQKYGDENIPEKANVIATSYEEAFEENMSSLGIIIPQQQLFLYTGWHHKQLENRLRKFCDSHIGADGVGRAYQWYLEWKEMNE